jgi:hypothetical protein
MKSSLRGGDLRLGIVLSSGVRIALQGKDN